MTTDLRENLQTDWNDLVREIADCVEDGITNVTTIAQVTGASTEDILRAGPEVMALLEREAR